MNNKVTISPSLYVHTDNAILQVVENLPEIFKASRFDLTGLRRLICHEAPSRIGVDIEVKADWEDPNIGFTLNLEPAKDGVLFYEIKGEQRTQTYLVGKYRFGQLALLLVDIAQSIVLRKQLNLFEKRG
jgi:hypothetical protein